MATKKDYETLDYYMKRETQPTYRTGGTTQKSSDSAAVEEKGTGKGTTARETLDFYMNRNTKPQYRNSVQELGESEDSGIRDWFDRYDKVIRGVTDYAAKRNGGYTTDASGGFSEDIASLIDEYEGIKGYAPGYGVYNPAKYLNTLKNLQKTISETDQIMAYFGSEEAYNKFVSEQEDYERKRTADLPELEKEIAQLEQQREDTKDSASMYQSIYDAPVSRLKRKFGSDDGWEDIRQQGTKVLDAEISQKKQFLNQAKLIQEQERLSSVADDPAFAQFSGYTDTEHYDPVYEYINDQNGARTKIKAEYIHANTGNGVSTDGITPYEEKGYDLMTEDEIAIYNYHYATGGREEAQNYLNSIQESLNSRQAFRGFDDIEDNTALELIFGVSAGLDQFKSGMYGAVQAVTGDADYMPVSAFQMTSGMVREDLADKGSKILGNSLGQVAYDTITTSANMLPSILASSYVGAMNPAAGKVVGTALLGASAGGNAYQEMLNLGYDKNQARAYAGMVAASETGLEYLLGGISKLGGKITGKGIETILNHVDNAMARVAIQLVGSGMSEFSEEYLQDVLEPWFQNLAMKTDNDISLFSTDALYSGLLGFVTAGVFEGTGIIYGEANTYALGRDLQKSGITAERLAELGKTYSADTVAYRLAGKVDANTGAYTIGRLFNEIGATLTEQNKADIASSLESKGMDPEIAQKHAEIMEYIVEGGTLSDTQMKMIEKNDVLADTLREVIIDPNSTVNQRISGYNEMAKQMETGNASENASRTKQTLPGQENVENGNTLPTQKTKAAESGYTVSEDGKTTRVSTGEEVQIDKIEDVKDGKITFRLKDGSTADSSDIQYANEDEALIYEAVAGMDVNAMAANILVDAFYTSKDVPANYYSLGIQEAFRYGLWNAPKQDMNNGPFSSILTEHQRNVAYENGRIVARQRAEQEQAAKAKQGGKKEAGKVHFDGDRNSLNQRQRTSLSALETIADALGIQIFVFESAVNAEGKHIGENGWYDQKDGSIHIDLFAGTSGQDTMLFTAAHELTHFIRDNSPAKFQTLADFLMEEYGKRGVSVSYLVDEQIRKAKDNGRTIDYDTAYEEVVADSMETMLSDGKVVEKLRQKDKSLWEMVKGYINDLAEKIRKVYAGLKPDSTEGKLVAGMKDSIEKIQYLFTEGLLDAAENYREDVSFENTAKDSSVKASSRENEDAAKRFSSEIAQWAKDGQDAEMQFILGSTGTVLQGLGAIESDIYMNGDKISTILQEHPEITLAEIQQIPKILSDPILILKSRNAGRGGAQNTRMTMFGSVKAQNGQPVMAIFDLRPVENHFVVNDMQKVTSAYTKTTDAVSFVKNSFTMYADKKRTASLLRTIGFRTPIELLQSGFVGSISYNKQNVNLFGAKFSDVFRTHDSVFAFEAKKEEPTSDRLLTHSGSIDTVASSSASTVSQDGDDVNRKNSMRDTVEYTSSLTPGEEGTILNQEGEPVAQSDEYGSVMFSMRTYEEEGRIAFRDYLNKCVSSNRITNAEMQEMLNGIEDIYNVCKEFKDKYAPFGAWSDASVVRDTYGRPVFSVVTPNGEYKMNLDFSLVCKKRRTLDAVFNEMSRRGIIDDFELGQKSVVKINEIIRKHGFETACALCFVDAKRFRQASMADSFTNLYNELVESLVPESQRGSIDHFNFAGYETIKKLDGGIDTWDASKLDFSHIDEVMQSYGKGTVEYKSAKYIKTHPEGRKLLLRGDLMSSNGFDAVKSQNKSILSLYNSKKGTGGPKAAFGDVQYMNEIIGKARTWTPAKAYAVGGVRIQSFSDYVPRMVFDYVQMIYDLAATKLPAHAYTKEPLFAKQFGLTGVKINMSLIPAIADGGIAPGLDANGNYVWAGESFDYETAKDIQNADGYTENCGTICVGVSYEHIRKLLSDPNIRMVIPYHKSGLNPIVAHMNKIAEFTDYTTLKTNPGGCQNTMDKNGNKVAVDFNFNEVLRKTGDPKATVRQYLDWCAKNEYTPRFAEFAWHENYYKLIEDFTLYDKNGNYVPQREVRSVFPTADSAFGSMKDLIQEGLEEDAVIEGKRDKHLSAIVDEIQNTLPKSESEISETQVEQADHDIESSYKFSERDPAMVRMNQALEKENSKLKEDVTELKKLLKLQKSLTNGTMFTKSSVESMAKVLMENAGAKGAKSELAGLLNEVYTYIARNEELTWEGVVEKAKPAVDWLQEHMETGQQVGDAGSLLDMDMEIVENLYDQSAAAQDLLTQVYDGYWRVSTLQTVADVKQKQIDRLKGEHIARMEKLKATHKEQIAKLKKEHRAELERVRQEYRANAEAKQEKIIQKYRESRAKGVESRNKTAMRHKVQNVVKELNSYLLNGTKDKHVPIELQKAVAEALDAVNMDTVGAEERIAKLKEELMKAKTPEKIQEISRKIDHVQSMGDNMKDKLQAMKAGYEEIIHSDDPMVANAYDPGIAAQMMTLMVEVGDTPLRDMSLRQLEAVHDVYTMVLTTIRNANKTFKAARNATVRELGQKVMAEVKDVGGKRQYSTAGMDAIRKFGWNNLKPVYAFEMIGSGTFSEIFKNVRAGEDVWAVDVNEARDFYLETAKKYGYNTWDNGKQYEFTSTSGMNFRLNLEQIMSLYAYSKREQAADHLRKGGIVIDETTEVTMKTKLGVKVKFNPTEATAYNISDDTLAEIIGKLTPEQKAYVDEMQTYLSSTMGEKGNEVSLQLYGVKLFKEKYYFPLKSASQYMAKAKEQQQGEVKIKNSGFSKETVKHASNPVVLTPFMQVWADHVNDMSMYHAFVLPMEDFYRVYNYKTPTSDLSATESVEMSIQNAYGKGATKYIDQLLKDLNGGARVDSTTGVINKSMNLFKKGAVFASASVVIQQPSAIARALSMIDMKYFAGPKVDKKGHKVLWEELKHYAPVAAIKEMGYFDTNMGKSTQDYILGQEYEGIGEKAKALFTDSGYRDEALSRGAALADEVTWCSIWEAVKRETKAKNPGMDVKFEEFLKLAGERFTDVIVKTQVYDSVLSRSADMRSKDTGMKMATAFMAEPTTSINMVADALLKGKRGGVEGRRYCRRAIGSVVAAQILNSILVSFVYAARDDDEDETYLEKYAGSFVAEVIDGLNPATYIPFIKDIVSIVQGYDVERSDMAVVSDLWNAWKQLDSDKLTGWRKVENFAGSICQIFGLPLKNIMRDVRAMYQAIDTFTRGKETTMAGLKYALKSAVIGEDVSDREQLYQAYLAGDAEHLARVRSRYDGEDSYNAAMRTAIREHFIAGDIDEAAAAKYLVKYGAQDGSEAHWTVEEWKYAKANGTSDGYGKYDKFYTAVRTGENLKAVIQEYTDNGVSEYTLSKQITSYFKPMYVRLSTVERSNIKGYLLNALEFCGVERDAAMERIGDWDFEAQYGFAYDDRKQAYMDGQVSAADLRKILVKEGGYTAEDAAAQVEVYDWAKLGYDATVSNVKKYNTYCKPAGVPKDAYLKIVDFSNNTENDVDEDGNTIHYSAVKKIMERIDQLSITDNQKTAIALSLWKESTVEKYKLW